MYCSRSRRSRPRRHPLDTSALRDAVTVAGIEEHQAALEAIANANIFEGIPTRATGTPGHEASVDYVVDKMTAAGFNVSLQPFDADIFFEQAPAAFEQISPNPTVYPRYDGEDGVWYTADFSGDGDATADAVAVDFAEPTTTASTSSSGCEPEDFGPEVAGKVVLLQRGTCDFGLKVENAQDAGAVAAVIFNEGTIGADDRNDILIPTLAGYDATIPVVGTDYATGRSLVDLANGDRRHAAREGRRLRQPGRPHQQRDRRDAGRAQLTAPSSSAHTWTRCTRAPASTTTAPASAMLLETAEQMHELGISPRNKVRFIFFSGEEQGLLGSDYYVSQLTKKQVQDISVMLDYDMLASGNYARFIYDGNGDEQGFAGPNGSGVIEQVFKDFWDSQGLAYETIPFDGRSDYDAFTIGESRPAASSPGPRSSRQPSRSRSTAAPRVSPFDPCYHQLCDTLANINEQGLLEHKDAAVHAILTFAQTTSSVNGTDKGSTTATKDWDWKGDKLVR